MTNKEIETHRKYSSLSKLGLSEEEIKQVIEDDEKIDKGEKLFELSDEQKKTAKKYKNSQTRTVKTAYGQTQIKEKKVDTAKSELIENLRASLSEMDIKNIEVTNAERELNFVYQNRKFKIVLSAPRT